jgi:hypothetical protein
MNPTALKIYAMHGQDLATGKVSIRALSRQLGTSFANCRAASQKAGRTPPPGTWRVVVAGDLHFCSLHHDNSMKVARQLGQFIDAQGRAAMKAGEKFTAVSIGDASDFASLSSWDRGRKSFEGREIRRDYDTVNECIRTISEAISPEVWAYMARAPFVTTGNHEHRLTRWQETNRETSEVFGIGYPEHDDRPVNLEWRKNGWQVCPFLVPEFIDEVAFMHYLPSPKSGKAIASVNQARALLMAAHQSVVCGHSHEFRTGRLVRLDGSKIVATVTGCSFIDDHDYAGYMGNHNADRGFTILRGLKGSEYTPQFLPFPQVDQYLKSRGYK